MEEKKMIEPCPICGEQRVIREENGIVKCEKCGVTLFTPKELDSIM